MATAPSSLRAVSAPLVLTTQAGRVVEQSSGARQWEAPNGWAPHQMLAWQGLRRWGLTELANRLTYRWLFTIVKNAADYHGTVPEKFDVVARSHRVFAEYGNVNTDFAYIAREGFGWMNASFLVGLAALPDELRRSLERRAAPEDVFR
jgi:alpha,alpha-trehalase